MKWLLGVSLVAIIAGAAATMTMPAPSITPDQAILKLFPQETLAIAFVDVAGLRGTPFFQALAAGRGLPKLPPKIAGFSAETGFVLERDVDRVTVGRLPGRKTLGIVQARFDQFQVERYLSDHAVRLDAHMGRNIYLDRDSQAAVSIVDNLIIAGHLEAVKKAIEQMSLPGDAPLSSSLTNAIQTIEAGNQIWAVADFQMGELPLRAPGPFREILKKLQTGTYQMRVDRDVHARATGNFADAETARSTADLARGLVALTKLRVAKEPDILQLLDGIEISNSGSSMIVNIEEPGDVLQKVQAYHRPRGRRQ